MMKKAHFLEVNKAKDLDCDFLGFAEEFHKKYPQRWDDLENNWDDYFKKLRVTTKVESSVINVGKSPLKFED